jgi:YD repeat-containing protein
VDNEWLSRVEDASGRYLAFDVDCLGELGGEGEDECLSEKYRLLSVSDHTSRTVGFGYDVGSGDLMVVTDTRGFAWTYAYSGTTHWLREVRDPYGHVIERNEYDQAGRVITQTDGLSQVLTFEYGRHSGHVTVTQPLERVQVDQYDPRNVWTGKAQGGATSAYAYDENFNRQSDTDANGHATRYGWSENGYNLESITDALSQTTHLAYDARNNLTQVVNAQGYTTTYEYDEYNNLITITDTLGGVTAYRYDEDGNLLQTTQNGAYTTTYAYDSFGQRVAVTDTLGQVTRYQYDALGRTVAVTTPQGITRYAYTQMYGLVKGQTIPEP